ncbi:MAG: hypothetical protein KC561_06630 [Myxococcales bacterium]|nr:hypothetical protein [Myxococcales bacterium]
MCLICIEFQKDRMSPLEARRALGEMRSGLEPSHVREVESMIRDKEDAAKQGESKD